MKKRIENKDSSNIELESVNHLQDCLRCPDHFKTFFDAQYIKKGDKGAVDDGYIFIIDKDEIDTKFGYR